MSAWSKHKSLLVRHGRTDITYSKCLAMDMDGTMIKPKSGRVHPKSADDWIWCYGDMQRETLASVPEDTLLVIISNQRGAGRKESKQHDLMHKIDNMISELGGRDIVVMLALNDDEYRKPAIGMWTYFQSCYAVRECLGYIGDAAGRPNDFSCSDRKFADNLGIPFYTPEEYFLGDSRDTTLWTWGWSPYDYMRNIRTDYDHQNDDTVKEMCEQSYQEMVVLVGPPASGKSHIAQSSFPSYVRVNRDTLGTASKCLKATREALQNGKSVVIDNTNPSQKARAGYVDIAQKSDVPIRCIVVDACDELVQHNNRYRACCSNDRDVVPIVALRSFRKYYEKPSHDEGYTTILTIPFIPRFANTDDMQQWCMWYS